MERIEISSAHISLSELVKHVSRDQVSIELAEGSVPLAKIVPIASKRSMADLDQALRENSKLGDDADGFAQDVLSVRRSIGELDDPWES